MALQEYQKKRDFARTAEPPATQSAEKASPLVFVVQKHAARRLHYDFRLEAGGVLKSWAVPGGPSLDSRVKRLAVMVEDHPLDYRSFEGTIPKGEYGAGQVIVWDQGDYSPEEEGHLFFDNRPQAEERVKEGLSKGKLSVRLRGHKLKGSWALVKMKRGENNWLLIKHQDDFADDQHNILEQDSSVLSGLTIEQLREGTKPAGNPIATGGLPGISGARQAPMPKTLSPMLASVTGTPFSHPDWLFEPKLDGYRTTAIVDNGNVTLVSRRGVDVTTKYPSIAAGLRHQPVKQLILDDEVVALDKRGKICFQCLQGYLETMGRLNDREQEPTAIIYYVFDVLYLDGNDLRELPLNQRKEILGRALTPSKQVRILDYFTGDGEVIYRVAVEQGLEGVVAKRKDSTYEPGRRSANWLKVKSVQTDDFIIGGYTLGTGNRAGSFGALVLGYYDDKGNLVSAGHVGTGFDDRTLTDFKKRLDAIKITQSPFVQAPEVNAPATWVRPELVVEVKFSEWTQDGRLRTPVFLRLRDDKPAVQVKHVEAVVTPASETKTKPAQEIIATILEQLHDPRSDFSLNVQGHKVSLSNLDKELWPKHNSLPALTKRDLLVYLTKVSPYLLKHLKARPLTLSRYPDGIHGEHFFQKHPHDPVPDFVATVMLSEHSQRRQKYLLCNNLETLLWLGQVADLEFHTWFSRISPGADRDLPSDLASAGAPDFLSQYPDCIIFDLDPYIYSGAEPAGAEPELNREGFHRTCEAALWLKEVLNELSLSCFFKTSGRTGLHIYVPILRQFDYHAVHGVAKTVCEFVQKRHPEAITTDWVVKRRAGKVFLDYNQNARGKTLVSIYSPRATPGATISCPLQWDELGKVYPTDFTVFNVPDRLVKLGDLWSNILEAKNDLKHLVKLS